MVATSAGLAPLRRSGLTLLSSRVGLNAFSHEMGDFPPNLLLRPGRFRIEMVFKRSTFSKMPYYRRAAKRPRYGKRLKYSVQQKAFSAGVVASPGTTLQPLVPATTLEGMRKVKHLMVNMAPVPDNAGPIYWAIVYVPQGTTPGVLNIDSTAVADINSRSYPLQQPCQSQPQQRRQHRTSPQADIHKHHGRRRHCSLRYHPQLNLQ